MWFLLGIFISWQVQALESFERLSNVKILKVLPKNILLLDRGLEDGIIKNDHIKLTQGETGYTARAICLRTMGDRSYWKLYRVPESERISMDLTYNIVGMADKEIPNPYARLREEKDFIDPDTISKKELGPDPFKLKPDLPERLTERDLIETVGPEQRKLFIERALNQDQLARDLKDYRVSIFASPFTKQTINDGKSYRYGIRGGNIASKYRLLTQLERQETRIRDPYTKEKVETSSTQGQAQFVIHRISPDTSTLALLNYNSMRFSEDIGTPRSHWQFGPIGFTWHLFENRTWEYFDISYVPLYDVRVTDYFDANNRPTDVKETGLRHGFRLAMKTKVNELVAFENILWMKPFQELASWRLRTDDQNLINDMKLIFTLSKNFFMDYNLIYQKDKLWKTISGLPSSNTINSINLRYDFDL
jgi:hypothetical protein